MSLTRVFGRRVCLWQKLDISISYVQELKVAKVGLVMTCLALDGLDPKLYPCPDCVW